MKTVEAIYEDGLLRPVEPLTGIANKSRVRLAVEAMPNGNPLADCYGVLPDEDAIEIRSVVDAEFEKVDPGEWS